MEVVNDSANAGYGQVCVVIAQKLAIMRILGIRLEGSLLMSDRLFQQLVGLSPFARLQAQLCQAVLCRNSARL
jgi:hypothetical protein